MLAIFDALSRSFLPAVSLYLAGFRCTVSELELCDFLHAASVGGLITRSRSCVMHSIITTLEIVIWYGAVIVLGVRQSGENIPQKLLPK